MIISAAFPTVRLLIAATKLGEYSFPNFAFPRKGATFINWMQPNHDDVTERERQTERQNRAHRIRLMSQFRSDLPDSPR